MNKSNLTDSLKGRIFGLSTYDGRRFNARLISESPCYVTIADNNSRRPVKLAKSNISQVRCG